MAEYGLLDQGLRIPTFDELVEEVIAKLRPTYGASYDFSDVDPIGGFIRVEQQGMSDLWQALEACQSATTRSGASGASLAQVLELTGTPWPEAVSSTVTLTLTGTAGTIVAAGSAATSASTKARWITMDDGELIGPAPGLLFSEPYALGVRVTGADGVYQVIDDGVSAASGALAGTGSAITHGTVVFRWLGEGDSTADVPAFAEVAGPTVAVSGDITGIDTPIGGWDGVVNLLDAEVGRNAATDGEARLAGESDIFRPAGTTPDAIRQALLDNEDVEIVDLIVNTSDTTDPDGVPPHAVEAIVVGGDDQVVADIIRRECVAAGIPTHGNTEVTSFDAEGKPHLIKFTRITEVPIYVAITVEKLPTVAANPGTYPSDGAAQVRLAITAWGNALTGGRNIVSKAVAARAFGVAGVLDVPTCNIGTAPSPSTSTTIVITRRQRGAFDTSRIAVTETDGTE